MATDQSKTLCFSKKDKMNKLLGIARGIFTFLIIGGITFWISSLLGVWDSYPKGNDAIGQVFHILQIAKFWPNIHWYHSWAGGMPLFIWYPILPYSLPALLVKAFSLSASVVLVSEIIAAVALAGFVVYGIVWLFTRNWVLSLAGGILTIATPAMYNHAFSGGQYARNFGFAFFAATLWAVFLYFQRLSKGQKSRLAYGLTVIFATLGTLSHFVIMIGIYPSIILVALLQPLTLKKKIYQIAKILVPAFLLSAFYLIPSFLNPMYIDPTSTFWENNRRGIPPFSRLINLTGSVESLNTLHPFLLIPAGILLIFVVLFARKRLLEKKYTLRAVIFLVLGILATLSYVYVLIPIYPLYLINGAPVGSLVYFPILASPLICILVGLLFRSKWMARFLGVLLILGIAVWSINYSKYPSLISQIKPRSVTNNAQEALLKKLIPSDKQFNFRVGTGDEGGIASWFNIVFPYVPQTRHYFGSGVLNIDDYIYGFLSIWRWTDNFNETKFNLDWWAVKQFISTDSSLLEKFGSLSDEYALKVNEAGLIGYDFTKATPILSTTNTPSLLVVGGEKIAYDSVLRSLAQANLNSSYFIPVRSDKRIDAISLDELKDFDIVFLYGYDIKKSHTKEKLRQYIEEGGGLIIESNKYLDEEEALGEILPVSGINYQDFGKSWSLDLGRELLGINKEAFGPAIFDEEPWDMGVASSVDPSSKILLSNHGKPLIVGKQLGKGRLVWSGMNLPYHINTYKNKEEGEMFGKILDWVSGVDREELLPVNYPQENDSLTYETDQFSATFINPQKRQLVAKTGARGVLFKEAYFYNWRAHLHSAGKGRSLPIYKAGPGMMYAPGPFSTDDVITFSYKLSFWPHKASTAVSLITLVFLVIYLFKGEIPFFSKSVKRVSKRVIQWWAREDEE